MATYKKICIDVGHRNNSLDFGATNGKIKESELALQISLKLQKQLQGQCEVLMTRKSENDIIDLPERTDFANKNKCDLFLSIHINDVENNTQANGIEVWHYAGVSNQAIAKKVCDTVCNYTGARNRGAKSGDFWVLRKTSMTAILIECGFIKNPDEVKKLQDSKYQDLIVRGIVEGLGFVYKEEEKKPEQQTTDKQVLYRVVAGTYANRENAEALMVKLKEKGFDSFIVLYEK